MPAWWMRAEPMPTLEERVAYLEGQFGEQARSVGDLRDAITSMDQRLNARIDRLDGRMDRLDGRFDRLDAKVDRQFLWSIGIQITVLLAVIGTLLRTHGR